jgi:hypothetical protein
MPISPRLARQLDQALGKKAAEDMVQWMQHVDTHRAELRDLHELALARFDAGLAEARHATRADVAELRQATQADIAELRQELQSGFVRVDTKLAEAREDMQAGFAAAGADRAKNCQEAQAGFAGTDARLTEFHEETQLGLAGPREETRLGFSGLREEMAHLETRLERRIGDLIRWSFVFWVGAVGAIAMLARVLG